MLTFAKFRSPCTYRTVFSLRLLELAQAALNVIAGEKAQDMSDLKVSQDLEPLKFAEFRIYYARLDYSLCSQDYELLWN